MPSTGICTGILERNSVGSEFQTIGPETEKARWPNVIRRQRGTVS